MKQDIFGRTLVEIQSICKEIKAPSYTAKQICKWLYEKHVSEFSEMTNLSLHVRNQLNELYKIGKKSHTSVQLSKDLTKKYLFPVQHGFVEAAMIPNEDRSTLCLSTQVGCRYKCRFCATGEQGFHGDLSCSEILYQYAQLPERDKITNIVYMGMGEPMDNLENVLKSLEIFTAKYGYAKSPGRITVSTIGIIPGMEIFLQKSKCHLAVSLHSPFAEERVSLMPIGKKYSLPQLIKTLKTYSFDKQKRLTFEYILFEGINDSRRHANALARLLHGMKCRVNLLTFHPCVESDDLKPSNATTIAKFQQLLDSKGITTTIRKTRGQDIDAACGLLSTKALTKQS